MTSQCQWETHTGVPPNKWQEVDCWCQVVLIKTGLSAPEESSHPSHTCCVSILHDKGGVNVEGLGLCSLNCRAFSFSGHWHPLESCCSSQSFLKDQPRRSMIDVSSRHFHWLVFHTNWKQTVAKVLFYAGGQGMFFSFFPFFNDLKRNTNNMWHWIPLTVSQLHTVTV